MRQINQLTSVTTQKSTTTTSTAGSFTIRSGHGLNRSSSGLFPAPAPATGYGLRRSASGGEVTEVIETGRGFRPSDRKDPHKREFLTDLTKRVFKVGLVS